MPSRRKNMNLAHLEPEAPLFFEYSSGGVELFVCFFQGSINELFFELVEFVLTLFILFYTEHKRKFWLIFLFCG